MDSLSFLKIFTILLLITTYCESQPAEFLTEDIDTTTICPEELAKRKLENLDRIFNETVNLGKENLPLNKEENNFGNVATSTDISDETTTICPEELEKKRFENDLSKETQTSSEVKKIVEETANKENSEEITTICPEELEKQKQEEAKNHLNRIFEKNTDHLEETNGLLNILERGSELDETKESTTICPEELEKRRLEKLKEHLNDGFKETISNSERDGELDQSKESTTICPEELEKQKLNEGQENFNKIYEKADNVEKNENLETTICPEELEKKKQEETLNKISEKTDYEKAHYNGNLDPSKETSFDELSPKEIARRKLEQSQKYLTKFKELIDNAQNGKASRRKRQMQMSDYSSYYPNQNQPTYNTLGVAGVAVSEPNSALPQQQLSYNAQNYNPQGQTGLTTNQNQPSYIPQGYSPQNYKPQPVKTFQQIRKQHPAANSVQKNPNFYPKTRQNNLKPVKTYRNPSTYVRYPSNGNLKNYYRLNNVGNRRQFQGARPVTSTSARPVRVTRKKKFKPSPVFA